MAPRDKGIERSSLVQSESWWPGKQNSKMVDITSGGSWRTMGLWNRLIFLFRSRRLSLRRSNKASRPASSSLGSHSSSTASPQRLQNLKVGVAMPMPTVSISAPFYFWPRLNLKSFAVTSSIALFSSITRRRYFIDYNPTGTICKPDLYPVLRLEKESTRLTRLSRLEIHSAWENATDGPRHASSYTFYLLQARPDRVFL